MKFVDAVAFCKTKFKGIGRLYEPRSKISNIEAGSIARQISPNQPFWIGIRARVHDEDRKFYYISQGPKKLGNSLDFNNWSDGGEGEYSGNKDCVAILKFNGFEWNSIDCTEDHFAICQVDVAGKEYHTVKKSK